MLNIHTDPEYKIIKVLCGKCESSNLIQDTIYTELGNVHEIKCIMCGNNGEGQWPHKIIKREVESMPITEEELKKRKEVGEQIINARQAIGLSQSKLAQKVGMNAGYLSNIENGNRQCPPELLEKITKALRVVEDTPDSMQFAPEPDEQEQIVEDVEQTLAEMAQKQPGQEGSQNGNGLRETEHGENWTFEDEFGRHAIITYRNGALLDIQTSIDEVGCYTHSQLEFFGKVAEKIRELEGAVLF